MAGDSRIQGAGPRLSLLDGDLSAVLQQLRFRGSSIRSAVFVSPGPTAGTAIVTNECSPETPYQVSSERNFRPGTPVLLGSYAGSGEETIISRAPTDKAGAASNPVRLSRGTLRRPQPPPPPPPVPDFLAVSIPSPFSTFKAWSYLAGETEPLEELAEGSLTALAVGVNPGAAVHRAPTPEGHVLVYVQDTVGGFKVVSLDCVTGESTVFVFDVTGRVISDIGVSDGAHLYFRAAKTITLYAQSAQLYRVPILTDGSVSGVFDTVMPAFAWGPFRAQDATINITSSLSWMGGETFQCTCTVSGIRKILRLEEGAWTVDSRTTLGNGNGANGNGYPLGGDVAAHRGLTSSPSGRPLLIDLTGPMVEALPSADWTAYSSYLGSCFSVSPSGAVMAYYSPGSGNLLTLPGGVVPPLGAGSPTVTPISPIEAVFPTGVFAL